MDQLQSLIIQLGLRFSPPKKFCDNLQSKVAR